MNVVSMDRPHPSDLDHPCDTFLGVDAGHADHGCGRDPYEMGAA